MKKYNWNLHSDIDREATSVGYVRVTLAEEAIAELNKLVDYMRNLKQCRVEPTSVVIPVQAIRVVTADDDSVELGTELSVVIGSDFCPYGSIYAPGCDEWCEFVLDFDKKFEMTSYTFCLFCGEQIVPQEENGKWWACCPHCNISTRKDLPSAEEAIAEFCKVSKRMKDKEKAKEDTSNQ